MPVRTTRRDTPEILSIIPKRDMRVKGKIMAFGAEDDYPELVERLILGSPTAVSARNVLRSFLVGKGFQNEAINSTVVGADAKGKTLTLNDILGHAARSVATYSGYYIKVQPELQAKGLATVRATRPLYFKDMRYSLADSEGVSAFLFQKVGKERLKFGTFSVQPAVVGAQMQAGAYAQAYAEFFSDEFFYPLSPFDAVAHDMDTEYQIAVFRNNTVRNGFLGATAVGLAPAATQEEDDVMAETLANTLGAGGDNLFTYTLSLDADNKIDGGSGIKVDQFQTSVDWELFQSWEDRIATNIRRAALNVPAVLVELDKAGAFGAASGESFRVAVDIYNELTRDWRTRLSQSLKELYKNFDGLRDVEGWDILELDGTTNIPTTAGN